LGQAAAAGAEDSEEGQALTLLELRVKADVDRNRLEIYHEGTHIEDYERSIYKHVDAKREEAEGAVGSSPARRVPALRQNRGALEQLGQDQRDQDVPGRRGGSGSRRNRRRPDTENLLDEEVSVEAARTIDVTVALSTCSSVMKKLHPTIHKYR
jgi:hypothetical protein